MSFLEPDDHLSLIKRELSVDDTLLAALGSPGITVAYLSANAKKKRVSTLPANMMKNILRRDV